MKQQLIAWIKMLVASFIHGAANSVVAVLGLTVGNASGLDVPKVGLKTFLLVAATSGGYEMARKLVKNPFPGITNDDSTQITKP